MNRLFLSLFMLLFFAFSTIAQDNYSVEVGPMPGHYTDSTEIYWYLLKSPSAKAKANTLVFSKELDKFKLRKEVTSTKVELSPLMDDLYTAWVYVEKEAAQPKQDITFLTGSCAFQWPGILGLGGKRKRKNRIFETMSKEKEAEFMVWTGDNVYYLFGAWNSYEKMVKTNLKARYRKPIRSFLESCPQYATWDDHDFGPNDSDKNFKMKDVALDIFKKFWANPYYGTNDKNGVYSHFSQGDADFFILDTRFDCEKWNKLFGDEQMKWLKERLLESKANFKFICSGTQLLPIDQSGENFGKYPAEKADFMNFLKENDIKGVVIISGDRHYSELNKLERADDYPLYEFTCSPLTSFLDPSYPKNNKLRIPDTDIRKQNYGRIKIFNEGAERICRIETFDTKGNFIWKYDIKLSEIR